MTRLVLFPAFLACAAAADLPIRQVILYKHGVGYFERSGRLGPGESARLDFLASEMNDVLKSLTLEEKGGGRIAGLRYDSSEPLQRRLAAFPFRLGEGQPLSAVLDQLKGARLELKFGETTAAGAIVAARVIPGDEKRGEREQATLLLDGGDLRTFDLSAASGLRFTDPKLQEQLKEYLAALSGAHSRDRRSVYIDSTDAGAREIAAGYLIPTPVWKSSYRLIFEGAASPTLEGWAIVDNTTGEDWTKVQLSLVSGRPVSFVSRLYEPRYVQRAEAELPEERAQAPRLHEGAVETADVGAVGGVPRDARGMRPMAGLPAPPPSPRPAAKPAPRAFASTIGPGAAARELGELFEYRIAAPVTVRKNESAMLPFLQQKVDARKLLIYADHSSTHPMNAAELVNSSGKTLDGGPITVYDGGGYAGEALFETLKAGDRRLISYAMDLGTRITTLFDSKGQTVRELHARRGVLTTRTAAVETRTYTIRNVDQKPKTLIVEHPARPEYTLLDQKPSEKTAGAYRFEVKLAAGATEKFPVTEERVFESTLALVSATPDLLVTYLQNKGLSAEGRKQLEQIAERKRRIAETDAAIRREEARVAAITADQDRIRRNLSSLNQVSGQQQQVQKYAAQLAAQETQLAAHRDRIAELQRQRAALETELNGLIENTAF
jgi:hypothetical protein